MENNNNNFYWKWSQAKHNNRIRSVPSCVPPLFVRNEWTVSVYDYLLGQVYLNNGRFQLMIIRHDFIIPFRVGEVIRHPTWPFVSKPSPKPNWNYRTRVSINCYDEIRVNVVKVPPDTVNPKFNQNSSQFLLSSANLRSIPLKWNRYVRESMYEKYIKEIKYNRYYKIEI